MALFIDDGNVWFVACVPRARAVPSTMLKYRIASKCRETHDDDDDDAGTDHLRAYIISKNTKLLLLLLRIWESEESHVRQFDCLLLFGVVLAPSDQLSQIYTPFSFNIIFVICYISTCGVALIFTQEKYNSLEKQNDRNKRKSCVVRVIHLSWAQSSTRFIFFFFYGMSCVSVSTNNNRLHYILRKSKEFRQQRKFSRSKIDCTTKFYVHNSEKKKKLTAKKKKKMATKKNRKNNYVANMQF